jgi:glycosyltransferase involved in cell wall biosynthesis
VRRPECEFGHEGGQPGVKIVHVVRTIDPAAGGLPIVPVRLAAAQAVLGHSAFVLAELDAAFADAVLFRDVPGGDRVGRLSVTPAGAAAMLGRGSVWDDLREHLRGMDIVHIHGLWEPVLWAAAKTARSLGRPYVLAAHGMLDPWSLAQKRWKKRLALALGWRGILNRAAALHLLNEDERRLVADFGLIAPTAIIPIGVPLDEIDQGRATAFAAARPAIGNRPYVLFVSRLHYKKGLDFLADAFRVVAANHPEVQLVVVGPDGGARGDFESRVKAAGLTDRVHVLGAISAREKWDALAGATCFCLPSRQEGFSMAILEALAARVPVVISDNCHFPEVAQHAAGIVVPLDAAATAAALTQVLANPEARRAMGAAGRRLVEDRFTWERVANTSVAAYEHALSR